MTLLMGSAQVGDLLAQVSMLEPIVLLDTPQIL
jgi:hypothetical protein